MRPRVTIRLDLAESKAEPRLGRVGPGKIALLEQVGGTGSISAAARAQGLSYRRAWRMIDEMNRLFAAPLVEAEAGGAKGGNARVTETGKLLLSAYRAIEADAQTAGTAHLAPILAALRRKT
jgi:molybdate transport system regulatory protein